ncbi:MULTISPECIES: uroporphyrinogen decarboxylase [Rhodomicrobium]|uniref:uroporphyrinogen decarboxylase n=1 Tax=Rhodomicrobium TaxID=1068 RepID=UPI000B4BCA1C|nr:MULTISPECIES: uroporphyrinogen decarboxylase [Rhodomicrobium]
MPADIQQTPSTPKLIEVLKGKALGRPPMWLMRQAGRYLPEYRELRAKANGFLDLCYRPEWAAEITLQPIRRFGFDAAILFADILIVPDALGQKVAFEEGTGPKLDGMQPAELLKLLRPEATGEKFGRICETVALVRAALPADKALIGFCGAPWTVATYMVAGHGTPDQAPTRLAAYRDPENFARLLDLVADSSVAYLSAQIAAGAQVVQIFDSWAGVLPDAEFERWVIAPTVRMVKALRALHPDVPIIGFPRGSAVLSEQFVRETGVDGLGCDTAMPLAQMRKLAATTAVQGNLDPLLLVAGGHLLESRIRSILAGLQGVPHIFNLGHGILQTTPIAHVERLVALVRGD